MSIKRECELERQPSGYQMCVDEISMAAGSEMNVSNQQKF